MDAKEMRQRVSWLVNTSVDDLRSSLAFEDDLAVISKCLAVRKRNGEKTKVTMLERKLKQMEKERIRALYLSRLADAEKEEGV